jgi:hypothetical protein
MFETLSMDATVARWKAFALDQKGLSGGMMIRND